MNHRRQMVTFPSSIPSVVTSAEEQEAELSSKLTTGASHPDLYFFEPQATTRVLTVPFSSWHIWRAMEGATHYDNL